MQIYIIISVLSIFFAILYVIETLGYGVRVICSDCGFTALGYSVHTQFATAARLLTLISFPIIGHLLDTGLEYKYLLILVIQCSLIYICLTYISYYFFNKYICISYSFLKFYLQKYYKITLPIRKFDNIAADIYNNNIKSIMISGGLAFSIVYFGVFITLILAALSHENRAMILQCSTIFTAAGTMISIFYFDPKVSNAIDSDNSPYSFLKAIILARLYSIAFISFIFSLILLVTSL